MSPVTTFTQFKALRLRYWWAPQLIGGAFLVAVILEVPFGDDPYGAPVLIFLRVATALGLGMLYMLHLAIRRERVLEEGNASLQRHVRLLEEKCASAEKTSRTLKRMLELERQRNGAVYVDLEMEPHDPRAEQAREDEEEQRSMRLLLARIGAALVQQGAQRVQRLLPGRRS